jgi:hypothetical protein
MSTSKNGNGDKTCSGDVDSCSHNPHVGEGYCGYRREDGTCASNFARDENKQSSKGKRAR